MTYKNIPHRLIQKIKHIGLYGTLIHIKNYVQKFSKRHTKMPFDFVQDDLIYNLHKYLRVTNLEINRLIMIGAHMAYEVDQILINYPNCNVTLFEASPRYINLLKKRFNNNSKVEIFNEAVSDKETMLTFYETNLEGSGSILPLSSSAFSEYKLAQAEKYEISSTTLDKHSENRGHLNEKIDCLWIDVQGAELMVLKGAEKILESNVKVVFLEVAASSSLYQNGARLDSITSFLNDFNFQIISLGLDYKNATGNAFFIKKSILKID
jgi:FkbM family methyltransferase